MTIYTCCVISCHSLSLWEIKSKSIYEWLFSLSEYNHSFAITSQEGLHDGMISSVSISPLLCQFGLSCFIRLYIYLSSGSLRFWSICLILLNQFLIYFLHKFVVLVYFFDMFNKDLS